MQANVMIPVELCGGPFCGHRINVQPLAAPFDTYLLTSADAAETWAYRWANRSTAPGRRVLLPRCRVGPTGKGGREGGGAAASRVRPPEAVGAPGAAGRAEARGAGTVGVPVVRNGINQRRCGEKGASEEEGAEREGWFHHRWIWDGFGGL